MTTPTPDDRSPSPGRSARPRAPTITIDTSAVSNASPALEIVSDAVPLRPIPNSPSLLQEEPTSSNTANSGWTSSATTALSSNASHKSNASKGSIPELRGTHSFESKDSRPTSPHNVSSPASKWGDRPHKFLAVPGERSGQYSVDSSDTIHSLISYGGETHVEPAPGGSAWGDTEPRDNHNGNRNIDVMADRDALMPDPGTEADFVAGDNKFAFTPGILNKLLNPKSLPAFYAVGGLSGLEEGLQTNRHSGLSSDETTLEGTVTFDSIKPPLAQSAPIVPQSNPGPPATKTATMGLRRRNNPFDDHFTDRKRIFKDNRLPEKEGKSLLQLMWITYNDKVLILLSIAAVVSLAVGLYQTFGVTDDGGPRVEWVEGVAIIAAIVIVVFVGSLNDYQKERQFVKLNKKKQDREVNVIRSGKSQKISVFDILVGDVVLLEPGDMVPVDGIFIDGHNLRCDESQSTGESDIIRKKPADEVFAAIESGQDLRKADPFILSGALVTEGVGSFLVTSTGVNSSHGKILMSLREDPEITPLQSKLNSLAEYIAKLGGAAGLLLFVVLFIEFLIRVPKSAGTGAEKFQQFLNIFIVTVTIIVVAVPEGLPLAVTLALAFATTRMLKDNNLVRHLKACEIMGNATAICSDKTGTLTQNKMTVVTGTLGTSLHFGGTTHPPRTNQSPGQNASPQQMVDNIHLQEVASALSQDIKTLLIQSVAVNSTAFEGEVDGQQSFVGSKTETALLTFGRDFLGMGPVSQERANAKIMQLIPFDSKRKCMGVVVQLGNMKYRLYVKGASEILLAQCTEVIQDLTKPVSSTFMTIDNRAILNNLITGYAERALRTIGLVYKDFDRWPPKHARRVEGNASEAIFEEVFKEMVFLGVIGIQDPLREGVREAVRICQKAGVTVRMVTGDNVTTAKAIATDCGIYTGGLIYEGPDFRKLSTSQKDQVIPSLQVLARSSPEDKRILVKRLKELGETVAVTGDGTNDAPALKTADVGFSMGISGTEVAREASAIILMDDNFASIVKAMMWGRAVNDAVKKFLQFQITVNITAVLLTFITAVSSDKESSVLTAVQLLWVNLIMDTLAALALATDPPTPSVLDRKPDPKSAPLISITMWKMIIGESLYQLTITLLIRYGAASIWQYEQFESDNISTFVFNTFVWMQIFNQWNNRRLDSKFNIFEGVLQNWFFIGVNVIMIGGQIMIILIGGEAFQINGLTGEQWGYSIFFGFLSIPIGAIIRLIPDGLIRRHIPESFYKKQTRRPQVTVEDEEQFYFPKPLADLREELSFLKKIKGGRLNNLKFAMQHSRDTFMSRSRSGSRSRSNSNPHTPTDSGNHEGGFGANLTPESRKRGISNRSRSNSALGATAVMTGIIAGSVGWSLIEGGHGDNGAARTSRSRSRTQFEPREGAKINTVARPDDTIIPKEPQSPNKPPNQINDTSLAPPPGGSLHPLPS